jgi:hypothetical protein
MCHGDRSLERENCVKVIEINRKKIFLVDDPLTSHLLPHFFAQNLNATRSVGL